MALRLCVAIATRSWAFVFFSSARRNTSARAASALRAGTSGSAACGDPRRQGRVRRHARLHCGASSARSALLRHAARRATSTRPTSHCHLDLGTSTAPLCAHVPRTLALLPLSRTLHGTLQVSPAFPPERMRTRELPSSHGGDFEGTPRTAYHVLPRPGPGSLQCRCGPRAGWLSTQVSILGSPTATASSSGASPSSSVLGGSGGSGGDCNGELAARFTELLGGSGGSGGDVPARTPAMKVSLLSSRERYPRDARSCGAGCGGTAAANNRVLRLGL